MRNLLLAAAAVMVIAGTAQAQEVSGAVVKRIDSGGLAGVGPGCMYFQYEANGVPGRVTLPLNATPNTPQLAAVSNLVSHPTISFSQGGPNPSVCPQAGWEEVPTMLFPGTP